MPSSPNQRETSDCLSCKLISSGGLTGSGIYVAYHVRNQRTIVGKGLLALFAAGLTYMGIARITNMYPFRRKDAIPVNSSERSLAAE